MKKKLIGMLLSITVIISLTACGKPTAESIQTKLDAGKYSEAVTDLTKLSEEEKTSVIDKFKAQVELTKEKYINGDINSNKAIESLTEIKKVDGLESVAEEAIVFVNKVNDSKSAFEAGKKAEEEKDDVKALQEYSDVIKEDKDNYEIAQNKITEVQKRIEDSILVSVESTSILSQNTQWKSLYPDMLQATIKNKSDKTIKSYKIGFLGYDANGYPLKIKGQFSFTNLDYEYIGTSEDANVLSGQVYGEGKGWALDESHGLSKVISCIKTVDFYDGTTWNNPLYNSWLAQHKEKQI